MGFSAGGYAGLMLASAIRASGFLGFSVRTDLSADLPVPRDRYVERESLRAAVPERLIDLRPVLHASGWPKRGTLYYGELNAIDSAHAKHLAGLPNFTVHGMPETWHNSVMNLIAAGRFYGIVRKFLG